MRVIVPAALLITLLIASCAADDAHARFPGAPPRDVPVTTGTLVLLLGQPANDVAVAIDGWLVFSKERTSRVVIDGVPIGTREVVLAANGGDKQFKIWVDADHATTVPIGVSEEGGSWWKTMIASIITIIVYGLMHPTL